MLNSNIPPLSNSEKDRAVLDILNVGLPEGTVPLWRGHIKVPLSTLCFGIEDCFFLAVLISCLCIIPASIMARFLPVTSLLFLLSPLLYALLHLLTWWKESMSGTLDWKRTCRLSFRTLTAMRMLYFGGVSVLFCVPQCWLLWISTGRKIFLPWMMSVAVTSVFLYGALSLRFQRMKWRYSLFAPPLLWAGIGAVLFIRENLSALLLQVPTLVFVFLSFAALSAVILEWRACLRETV